MQRWLPLIFIVMKKKMKKAQDSATMKTDSNRPPSLDKSKMSKRELRTMANDSMRSARAANKAKKK